MARSILRLVLAGLILGATASSGCDAFKKSTPATVKIKKIVAKLVTTAGRFALEVAADEMTVLANLGLDSRAVLNTALDSEVTTGLPPGDIASFLVVNTKTRETRYWKLTENVKQIRLTHENPGRIDLKLINDKPLRVELWFESEVDAEVTIELKD